MIELGQKVTDRVSGFSGIATSRTEYLNGCVQIGVQPPCDSEKPSVVPDLKWFDEEQIDVVGDGIKRRFVAPTGGGIRATPPGRHA